MCCCARLCISLHFCSQKRAIIEEIDIDDLPMEDEHLSEDEEDLDKYSFSKFASMYFQGAATPTHVRHKLRQPLLHHEDEGDVLVLLLNCFQSLWVTFSH